MHVCHMLPLGLPHARTPIQAEKLMIIWCVLEKELTFLEQNFDLIKA